MITASSPATATAAAPVRNYLTVVSESPCEGCAAPCCRMVIFPHQQPQTYLDFDYLRYVVGFRNLEVLVHRDGDWSIAVSETCRHLDAATSRCSVHGTARQPKVCTNYPGDGCWYRNSFTGLVPGNVIRLDSAAIEALLPLLAFDAVGRLVAAPSWDDLERLAQPTTSQACS